MYTKIAAAIRSLRGKPEYADLVPILEQLANGAATRNHRGQVRVDIDGNRDPSPATSVNGDTQVWPAAAGTFRNPASTYNNTTDMVEGGAAMGIGGVLYIRPTDGGVGYVSSGDVKCRNTLLTGDVQESDGTIYQWPNFTIDDCAEYWQANSVAGTDVWGRASGYPLLDAGSVARSSGWLTDDSWDFGHTTGQFLSSGSVSLNYTADWSLVLAVNIDTLSGYDPVLWSYGDDGTTKPLFLRVNASGGTLALVATDNGTTARTTTGSGALAAGTNYLLGVSWDASSETISIYKDGELDVSADLSAYTWPTFTAPQLRIGNRVDNTTGQELDGQVDTVLVRDVCMSAREMKWYYQARNLGIFGGGNAGATLQDGYLRAHFHGLNAWP